MKLKSLKNLELIFPICAAFLICQEKIVVVSSSNLIFFLTGIKNHINYQYKLLSCISGVDFLGTKYRFSVVYDLLSLVFNSRIRIKTFINETTPVDSSVIVFKCANWWEREVWDLYGIYFINHPDLRRILTDYGFEGHPMRKDFPVFGYVETRYNLNKKRVVLEPVEFSQDLRFFLFDNSWGF